MTDLQHYDNQLDGTSLSYRVHPSRFDKPETLDSAQDYISRFYNNIEKRIHGPPINLGLIKANVYLYSPQRITGGKDIPVSLTDQFSAALYEVRESANTGAYNLFEVTMTDKLALPSRAEKGDWLWATMRYRQQETNFTSDRWSHLAIREDEGFINKVRYTYPANLPTVPAFEAFQLFLYEWQVAIDWAADNKNSEPPQTNKFDRSQLHFAPVPHPLGFFNPEREDARQRELAAQHFKKKEQQTAHSSNSGNLSHSAGISQTLGHEIAHVVFSMLEKKMALKIGAGGFSEFIEEENVS